MCYNQAVAHAENLAGKTFGKLLVISRAENISPHTAWNCTCSCGGKITVRSQSLKRGQTKSCGCLRAEFSYVAEDLTGQIFGRLTAVERTGTRSTYAIWRCQCSCGNVVVRQSNHLKNGSTKSCGCIRCTVAGVKILREKQEYKDRAHAFRMHRAAQGRANRSGIPFTITPDDIPVLPKRCPVLGIVLSRPTQGEKTLAATPSLDRIIPALGYTPGNIRIISWRANSLKKDGTLEELQKLGADARRLQRMLY